MTRIRSIRASMAHTCVSGRREGKRACVRRCLLANSAKPGGTRPGSERSAEEGGRSVEALLLEQSTPLTRIRVSASHRGMSTGTDSVGATAAAATATADAGGSGAILNVAVLTPPDNPALKNAPPAPPGVRFTFGNSVEDFTANLAPCADGAGAASFDAVVFIPPASPQVLLDLWPHIQHSCTWVHSFFAGVDGFTEFFQRHMVRDGALVNRDVAFTNGKGAFSDSLAEYVLAAALHFNKRIPACQANRAARRWDKFVMPTMRGKTMGFLGFGDIAKATARAAKVAFGMRVVAARRNPDKARAADSGGLVDEVFGTADMGEVFAQSDFVVSVLPGTEETRNVVDETLLRRMKPSGVFISIGRGTVVDEDALAKVLQSGTIAGAALDVFQAEPLDQASRLWDCDNLLVTAHNADYTEDYFALGWDVWGKNFAARSAGQEYVTPIDPVKGY